MVNTRANDHDIVDNSEATLTADPPARLVLDPTVDQYGGLVHDYALLMEDLRKGQFFFWEEIPGRTVDDFFRCVTKDPDDGNGGVQYRRFGRKIWPVSFGLVLMWGLLFSCHGLR